MTKQWILMEEFVNCVPDEFKGVLERKKMGDKL